MADKYNVDGYSKEVPYDAYDEEVDYVKGTINWRTEPIDENDESRYYKWFLDIPNEHLECVSNNGYGNCYDAGLDSTEKFRYAIECAEEHEMRNWA